ncbi:MAG: DUF4118 domain-containing protein [Planctomycetes bacterium]|nr:DUF4118 domain-containing protein [Planctomycetota bacterium]NUQ34976.1 DUF4118 domain-containing protein [Planctomycetaceae bacterium]
MSESHSREKLPFRRRRPGLFVYGSGLAVTGVATAIAYLLQRLGLSDASLIMTYLAAVVYVASRAGRGPAVFASVVSVLQYNFFFTQPYYSFVVEDKGVIYDFLVMFAVALVISTLTTRIRRQAQTEALYRVIKRLVSATGTRTIAAIAEEELRAVLPGDVAIYLPEGGKLERVSPSGASVFDSHALLHAFERKLPAGAGTGAFSGNPAIYLPLSHAGGAFGVLAWRPADRRDALEGDLRRLFESFAHQISLVLERDMLAQEAQRILAQIEAEKLRSSLLSSVSHDLRTPLAAIAGSAALLLDRHGLAPEQHEDFLQTIHDEAQRMARLVDNLLSMTRIESGAMGLRREWQALDEVIESAIRRVARAMENRDVRASLPGKLPLVAIDGLLIEQVLINLLENAAKYSPARTPVNIVAKLERSEVVLSVRDKGQGLPPHERERVFEKFYRSAASQGDQGRGAGLGLAICHAIVKAHGGRIWADANDGGGSVFSFTIPVTGQPPVPGEAPELRSASGG